MKVCILGMENDRLVGFTRFLIQSLEEKENMITKCKELLEQKEKEFSEAQREDGIEKKLRSEIAFY